MLIMDKDSSTEQGLNMDGKDRQYYESDEDKTNNENGPHEKFQEPNRTDLKQCNYQHTGQMTNQLTLKLNRRRYSARGNLTRRTTRA